MGLASFNKARAIAKEKEKTKEETQKEETPKKATKTKGA